MLLVPYIRVCRTRLSAETVCPMHETPEKRGRPCPFSLVELVKHTTPKHSDVSSAELTGYTFLVFRLTYVHILAYGND
jgi:hypothetical protein